MLLFASHLKPRLRGPRKMLTWVLYFFIKDSVKSHSLTSKCLAADPQWYMRYTDLVSLSHLISSSVSSASFQCYLLTFPSLFPKRYTWCFRSFTVIYLHHFLYSTFFLPVSNCFDMPYLAASPPDAISLSSAPQWSLLPFPEHSKQQMQHPKRTADTAAMQKE